MNINIFEHVVYLASLLIFVQCIYSNEKKRMLDSKSSSLFLCEPIFIYMVPMATRKKVSKSIIMR